MKLDMFTMINLVIIAIFILFLYSGYKQGFLMKLISIIGFVVVGIFSWWMSEPLSRIIGLYPKNTLPLQGTLVESFLYENLNRFVVFVILFVLLNIALLLIKPLLKVISDIPVVSTLNKVCGLVLGAIQAILLLFVAALVLRLPFIANGSQIVNQTLLRYSEPLMDVVLFYAKEPIQQVQVLMDIVDDTEALNKEEIANVRTWLLSYGIEEDKVDALIASLRSE